MKPVMKYAGGKSRELHLIKPFFPEFKTYIEPFVGGGSVFFDLELENSVINDFDPMVTQLYTDIAFNRDRLIEELKSLENTEECYYQVRDMFNGKAEHDYLSSTLYLYLNRTRYQGMVRYNQKGEMNVSYGRYKTYEPWKHLTEEVSELLQKTTIHNSSFEELLKEYNQEDCFFYCDPPYMGAFKDYGGFQTFTEEKHILLCELFKESKAKIMINISDVGIIRELYEPYIKAEYDKSYSFNIKNRMENSKDVKHLIITNY